jgi:cation diffusion facilitator CzcD-associated flavoprotein CzcO
MVTRRESMTRTSVAIIGAGFGGIAMAIKLKQAGIPFTILERGSQVGGVWSDNTYPGAACDIPSHLYSFSFEPNPAWSRTYSPQSEIRAYLEQCARKHDCLEHVRFGHEIERATFDSSAGRWRLASRYGDEIEATFLVAATGQLSRAAPPTIPGLDTFSGRVFHSARWDHSFDLSGKRVAVVGTGASAIQFVPQIAPQVGQLFVFQRSAPYVFPKVDRSYTRLETYLNRHVPLLLEASRARQYTYSEARMLLLTKGLFPGLVRQMWKGYLRTQVEDERLRAVLTPNYPVGCKRVLISNDWYAALIRPNVTLIPTGVAEVRKGQVLAPGLDEKVDAIICATGFSPNDFLAPMTVEGRGGIDLRQTWRGQGGAEAYLGVTVSGFPNLFILYGPNTNLGHNSIIYMLESQVEYVLGAVQYANSHGVRWLDVDRNVQEEYNRSLSQRLSRTVWQSGCNSWYVTETGKNVNNWPGFTFEYRRLTRHFDPGHYQIRKESSH